MWVWVGMTIPGAIAPTYGELVAGNTGTLANSMDECGGFPPGKEPGVQERDEPLQKGNPISERR